MFWSNLSVLFSKDQAGDCVTSHKSEDLIYTVAETWTHATIIPVPLLSIMLNTGVLIIP